MSVFAFSHFLSYFYLRLYKIEEKKYPLYIYLLDYLHAVY